MTRSPRFLIVEGNARAAREAHKTVYGETPGQSYASVVQSIEATALCDIALPADEGANLPDPAGLESYDGAFVTGSSLNIYEMTPPILRQIELMRAIFQSGTPAFGSCWGLQLGAVAAGGSVRKNPKGREILFARRLTRAASGAGHPMLEGRPAVWDAPAWHLDEIVTPPADAKNLAFNAMSDIQAMEFSAGGGLFWGVQYHPEFSLREVSAIMRRRAHAMIDEGFAAREDEVENYCDDLVTLHDDPARADLAWRYGIDEQVLDPRMRLTEIRNFIAHRVRPAMSARGRD